MPSTSANELMLDPIVDLDDEPAAVRCWGLIRLRSSAADKARQRAFRAMEMIDSQRQGVVSSETVSSAAILTNMLSAPVGDIDAQLAGLMLLRNLPVRELCEASPVVASTPSTSAAHNSNSSAEDMTWRAPEWNASVDALSAVPADGRTDGRANGKGKQKAAAIDAPDLTPLAADAELPSLAPLTDSCDVSPRLVAGADVLDAILHAMHTYREHSFLQEHACALLATIAAQHVREGLSEGRGGHAGMDAASRQAAREEATKTRAKAVRGGVIAALVCAMRDHGALQTRVQTRVVAAACVALWGLCDGASEAASEAKQQAASAGAIELLAAVLQLNGGVEVWTNGKLAFTTLVRHEPALRRRAKRALPRFSICYNLGVLSL